MQSRTSALFFCFGQMAYEEYKHQTAKYQDNKTDGDQCWATNPCDKRDKYVINTMH